MADCPICGHEDRNARARCGQVAVLQDAPVIEEDGSVTVEPEIGAVCGCRHRTHAERRGSREKKR